MAKLSEQEVRNAWLTVYASAVAGQMMNPPVEGQGDEEAIDLEELDEIACDVADNGATSFVHFCKNGLEEPEEEEEDEPRPRARRRKR